VNPAPRGQPSPFRKVAGWFIRGLLITAPVAVTIWLTWTAIRWVDGLIGVNIPGVGLLVTLLIITGIGALGSSWLARGLLAWIEDVLESLPFIRLLYTSSKDLLNAFVGEKRRFKKAVRVSLTADGSVSVLGFVTAESMTVLGADNLVGVYLPQSYNFAGQFLLVPADRVTPLAADSSDVMAMIVSGGVSGAEAETGTGHGARETGA
jgi:uncharacterized membrane protein